jgi:hypothetical protein
MESPNELNAHPRVERDKVGSKKVESPDGIQVLEYNGCAHFTIDNIAIVTQP